MKFNTQKISIVLYNFENTPIFANHFLRKFTAKTTTAIITIRSLGRIEKKNGFESACAFQGVNLKKKS